MSDRSPSAAQQRLRKAFRSESGDVASEVIAALALGATPNDLEVQKSWLSCPPLWSDKLVNEAFKRAGLQPCKGLPLRETAGPGVWIKFDLLMEQGLEVSEIGPILMGHPDSLSPEGFELLDKCLQKGFIPTQEQASFVALETEDTPRTLLLVSHQHLGINDPCPLEEDGHPLTFAQGFALFSRQVWMDEWLEAGADLVSPLASGRTLVTRILTEANKTLNVASPPIPTFRAQVLLAMAQRDLVDWLKEDAFGTQPIQALRSLPPSDDPLWGRLVLLAERQSLVQDMERSYSSQSVTLPHPTRTRF